MNNVILVGRLTYDPEYRTTTNSSVAKFSVAVDRDDARDFQGQKVDFIRCEAWGQLAETINKYLKKGMMVSVRGSLCIESYEKDGVKKDSTFVKIDKMKMLESRAAGEARANGAAPQPVAAAVGASSGFEDEGSDLDSEIPF